MIHHLTVNCGWKFIISKKKRQWIGTDYLHPQAALGSNLKRFHAAASLIFKAGIQIKFDKIQLIFAFTDFQTGNEFRNDNGLNLMAIIESKYPTILLF